MWVFTTIANWWDENHRQAETILDDFVERNPNRFAIIVATAAHTSMVLGSGMVDVLRLGDGVAEGTPGGVASDGLRLLVFAGPLVKLAAARSSSAAKIAQLIVDPGGPMCSWVAATKALAQTRHRTGGKLFASVEDLARAVGVPWEKVGGISLQQMAQNLRAIGANIGPLRFVSSMKEVSSMLRRDGGVVLVSFRVMRGGKEVSGHAMYAFYDHVGQLKIMDRTGIHSNIADIPKLYGIDEFIPRSAMGISNVYAKYADGVSVLAMEVAGVAATKR